MPKISYCELIKKLENYPCSLYTTQEEYIGTSDIKWKCICGEIISSSYKELIRWKGLCLGCRKKDYKPKPGSTTFYTYEVLKKIYEDAGCQLLTDENHYQGTKTSVVWKCKCGEYQNSTPNSFVRTKRCRKCGIRSYKEVTFQDFCNLLGDHGWKMISEEREYKNTKTPMKIRTNNGGVITTSYNRFQQGHRSKREADDLFRKDYEEVKKLFEEKEFILLEEEYVSKSTPMKYKCRCGEINKISYENMIKNIIGCMKCCDLQKPGNGICDWETNGKYYLKTIFADKIKDYKFPSGKIVKIQGYEDSCLNDLLEEGLTEEDIIVDDIPTIQYLWNNHYHLYYPDIYIPSQNKIIEVKSEFTFSYKTEQNKQKWISTAKEGYTIEVHIYIRKKRIEKHTYLPQKEEPMIEKYTLERKTKKKKEQIFPSEVKFMKVDDIQKVEIEDWPGCMVSNEGRVYGQRGKEYVKILKGEVLKVQLEKKVNGKHVRHRCPINYLVMKHFLPEKEKFKVDDFTYTITNKNNDPYDNRFENLEIKLKEDLSNVKNVRDIVGRGILQLSKEKELIAKYESVFEASQKTGISIDNIKQVCRGRRKNAGGFIWEYQEILKPDLSLNVESWKYIPDFSDYKISRKGEIWSRLSNSILKPYEDGGFLRIKLTKDEKKHNKTIHLLVAATYLPSPSEENMVIRHRNMNKLDNKIGNLEWVHRPSNVPTKPVIQLDKDENEIKYFPSIKEASEETGANENTISLVCNGKRSTSGGFKWKWG